MKCILHVGPPKTGSTSVQAFLRQNKENLLESGVLALADNRLPRKLVFFFSQKGGKINAWAKRHGLDKSANRQALQAETDEYIREQIGRHEPDTLVLSCENLSRLPGPEIKRMRDYLSGLATDIEVVLFLRRQDFRVLSGYKNRVRNMGCTEEITPEYRVQFDDVKMIDALAKCFGKSAITPIICQDSHPRRTDADGHFEALLKVLLDEERGDLANFVIPERKNIAWDYRAISYMREFNRLMEESPDLAKYQIPLGNMLQARFAGGKKPRVRKSVAEAIVANYQPGWEAIRKQYFPDEETLFHSDFSMYSEDNGDQEFGAREAVDVSLQIFGRFLKRRKAT